ncbi:MAG TPA: aminomethyltransferase family protein, partial [Acidobacteriota bacterium]|nr:aminomethyltransferase family protein [Acidobacteriota bacterium]
MAEEKPAPSSTQVVLRHGAPRATAPLHYHRADPTPFFQCMDGPETVYAGPYSGRMVLVSVGDDPQERYWNLRQKVVLYNVPEHPIEIAGPDAERLLNKVFVRDITKLKPGRCGYGIACLPDGGILMDGILMRVEADRFWYVLADGEIFTWLVAHGMGMDVTVSDPQSWVLQVGGPRSLEVLDAACDGGAPDPFAYFAVTECTMGGQPLYLSRTGWTSEVGWEVYTRDPEVDGPALWNHILEAGKAQEIITTGLDSMNIRCIEAGILDNGSDFDTSMTPYQAGIGKFVDMNKDDFIGKEALAAADRRPLLFGIRCPTAAPSGVSPVTQGDTEVGTITTGAWSPYLGHGTGYVRFHEAGDWLGAAVSVSDVEGQMHVAEVVELPFYDPEKRISRGLDTAIPEGPLAVTQA